jgi:MerR family transcriptional regulator, light-induced transcriptional regulator
VPGVKSPAPIVGVRVGELARRVGVSPETLRAWESRYGVLRPARTSAGYRVYGREDELRARRMRELIESGWAAGEAAHAVTDTAERAPAPPESAVVDELVEALTGFDSVAGHAAFDRVLGARSLDAALRDVVLPALRQVGERWASGEISVAQEHFATELITGRLRGLGREWGAGLGPRAVLACPSGERHDVGLLCCGLALDRRGWRVTYLGADTPVDALESVVGTVEPAIVVIGAVHADPLQAAAAALGRLAERVPVAVGGTGACADLAAAASAWHLSGDPVAGAAALTAERSAA